MHSLRPQQIAYVLPGGPYKEKDLHAVDTEASAAADKSLMELAWEVRIESPSPPPSSPPLKVKRAEGNVDEWPGSKERRLWAGLA